jgi:hypothetical protein
VKSGFVTMTAIPVGAVAETVQACLYCVLPIAGEPSEALVAVMNIVFA